MTAIDIERLEQAARSVFGHDEGDTVVTETQPRLAERLRALFRRRLAVSGAVA